MHERELELEGGYYWPPSSAVVSAHVCPPSPPAPRWLDGTGSPSFAARFLACLRLFAISGEWGRSSLGLLVSGLWLWRWRAGCSRVGSLIYRQRRRRL